MPFGLEAGSLHLLGQGTLVVVAMGRFVSQLAGAVTLAPAMPMQALLLMTAGGLWLVIWRKNWRWWGLVPVLLGARVAWRATGADMLAADGCTAAIRGLDGLLHFVRKPSDKYLRATGSGATGDARDIGDAVGVPAMACDGVGCVMQAP